MKISIYNNKGSWEAYENFPDWNFIGTDRHQEWAEQAKVATGKPYKVLNPEVVHPALQTSNSIILWTGGYEIVEGGVMLRDDL